MILTQNGWEKEPSLRAAPWWRSNPEQWSNGTGLLRRLTAFNAIQSKGWRLAMTTFGCNLAMTALNAAVGCKITHLFWVRAPIFFSNPFVSPQRRLFPFGGDTTKSNISASRKIDQVLTVLRKSSTILCICSDFMESSRAAVCTSPAASPTSTVISLTSLILFCALVACPVA